MKPIGFKRLNIVSNNEKSQITTAINSQNGSRKNSTYLQISRDSQLNLPTNGKEILFLNLPQVGKNKKCLNVTVKKNKGYLVSTDRTARPQAKHKRSIFNFCQEVPIEQNFYTFINNGAETQRIEWIEEKQPNLQKSLDIQTKSQHLQLTCPSSPIHKLIQLDEEEKIDSSSHSRQKSIVQWQKLLGQL